jgi:hypothetical protein
LTNFACLQASFVAVEIHDDMSPGAQATVFAAIDNLSQFCHLTSGEYHVWINSAASHLQGYCALKLEQGLDCCGASLAAH